MSRTLRTLFVAILALLVAFPALGQDAPIPAFSIAYDPRNDCAPTEEGFAKRMTNTAPTYNGGKYVYFPGYSTDSYGNCPSERQLNLAASTRGPNAVQFLIDSGWPANALVDGGPMPGEAAVLFRLIPDNGTDGIGAYQPRYLGVFRDPPTTSEGPGDTYRKDNGDTMINQAAKGEDPHWELYVPAGKDAYQPRYLGVFRDPPTTSEGPGDTYQNNNGDTMINWAQQGEGPCWELYVPAGKKGDKGEGGDGSFESFRIYATYSGLQARMTDPVTKIGRDSFLLGIALDWRIRSWMAATASYKLGYGVGNLPDTEQWGATSAEVGILFIPKRWSRAKIWIPLTGRWDGFETVLPGTEYRLANAAAASGFGFCRGGFFIEAKALVGISQLPSHEHWGVATEDDLSFGWEVSIGGHIGNGWK